MYFKRKLQRKVSYDVAYIGTRNFSILSSKRLIDIVNMMLFGCESEDSIMIKSSLIEPFIKWPELRELWEHKYQFFSKSLRSADFMCELLNLVFWDETWQCIFLLDKWDELSNNVMSWNILSCRCQNSPTFSHQKGSSLL